ncbi:MAG: hypothetical protein AB1295_02230 [Candidatus Micrarchaeota archaeon]
MTKKKSSSEKAGKGPAKEAKAPQKEATPEQKEMAAKAKDMETAIYALKFYPVAVNEHSKDEAVAKLERVYREGNETVRQMLLYMIHENLAGSMELKIMHTQEYFRMKNPSLQAPQHRMNVYRAIFNYNTSLEGLAEMISFLGRLHGDDAAKLLTYHYSFLCSVENEAVHVLRAAILEALGASESKYALTALLAYARYTDSERTFNRVVSALIEWEGRLDKLNLPEKEKQDILGKLKEIITSEFRGSHYG